MCSICFSIYLHLSDLVCWINVEETYLWCPIFGFMEKLQPATCPNFTSSGKSYSRIHAQELQSVAQKQKVVSYYWASAGDALLSNQEGVYEG
jgi:hypothetical protein